MEPAVSIRTIVGRKVADKKRTASPLPAARNINEESSMESNQKNFQVVTLGDLGAGRATLNEHLGLTGSEISINELPAGVSVPFVHAHKRNEEVYIILDGKGKFYIDGDEFEVAAGTVVRVDPAGARCITADAETSIKFICIQTEAQSLVQFTENDGIMVEAMPSWL
jgi:mannose-6-phosphate isomerase-like protein (cupin superfamily)